MNGLENLIKKSGFEFGSRNYDDDFHTDVLFYRCSCTDMREYIGDAHTTMIAFQKDFCSSFYYPAAKTQSLCRTILDKIIFDDAFFNSFEENYLNACHALEECWDSIKSRTPEENYLAQLACQKAVYRYCWPFEVLQTTYGIEREITARLQACGYSTKECEDILYTFGADDQNVYYQENEALYHLGETVCEDAALKELFTLPIKHLRIMLPAPFMAKLSAVFDKYKYLYYHGYSDRRLPTICDYIARVKASSIERAAPVLRKMPDLTAFDNACARLLYCYYRLAGLKSIRRLAQLKNFYYLDAWLSETAQKHGINEAILRAMTPEEILAFLHSGQYDKQIEARLKSIIYIFENGHEKIYGGEDIAYFENLLTNTERKEFFQGKVACKGFVVGRVRKVLRPSDATDISSNDIIFTHEGDPDLLPLLKKAGGVVCEQGGITCHMAIIAREYNIPCIIGVGDGASKHFQENDIVTLDAIKGIVKKEKTL